MPHIQTILGHTPTFGKNVFLAANCVVVGNVKAGDNCTIWFNAIVRGDVNSIVIGDDVNIQDGAVIHCTYERAATTIGNRVSIGHNAIVHGCTVKDDVLIGMGAIIMDNAVIGEKSIIAAGAVVLAGTVVEPGSIYAGTPAKKVKDIDEKGLKIIETTVKNYPMYAEWFKG